VKRNNNITSEPGEYSQNEKNWGSNEIVKTTKCYVDYTMKDIFTRHNRNLILFLI